MQIQFVALAQVLLATLWTAYTHSSSSSSPYMGFADAKRFKLCDRSFFQALYVCKCQYVGVLKNPGSKHAYTHTVHTDMASCFEFAQQRPRTTLLIFSAEIRPLLSLDTGLTHVPCVSRWSLYEARLLGLEGSHVELNEFPASSNTGLTRLHPKKRDDRVAIDATEASSECSCFRSCHSFCMAFSFLATRSTPWRTQSAETVFSRLLSSTALLACPAVAQSFSLSRKSASAPYSPRSRPRNSCCLFRGLSDFNSRPGPPPRTSYRPSPHCRRHPRRSECLPIEKLDFLLLPSEHPRLHQAPATNKPGVQLLRHIYSPVVPSTGP